MKNIEVVVIQEPSLSPVGMTGMLAKLTQRGHKVKCGEDLIALYESSLKSHKLAGNILKMQHGSTIRHSPVTLAIIGASRRVLAQIRTHKIGIEFVSASLQYSDYSGEADFVVPYEVLQRGQAAIDKYIQKCKSDLKYYEEMVHDGYTNDTAGYTMNQALRNVIVCTANTEAWLNLINRRACKRNTNEMAYVAALIWEALLNTKDGATMYQYAGPDCLWHHCREGHLTCGEPMSDLQTSPNPATRYIEETWPLVRK